MVGSLRSSDGAEADVFDEEELLSRQDPETYAPKDMTSVPAECTDDFRATQLSDVRIESAGAMLSDRDSISFLMISSDSSGLLWAKMHGIDRFLGYCDGATLTVDKQRMKLELDRLWPDLNGSKSFSYVYTITGPGFSDKWLLMMSMSGNLFVSGSHPLFDGQDLQAAQAELRSYVNAALDLAKQPNEGISAGPPGTPA
ncbi:hypothetical protein [Arthrobacter celericrescens]|uniref:hypothetical protein n=1 Tax=Arthrobacter celericrescens TaxID=2320851 RepID=UPI000EA1D766|nr:hypothetical protein [Arthrobacter celericrescens]